jgi:hypothetical protein
MPRGKIFQRLRNLRQKLYGMVCHRVGKAVNLIVHLGCHQIDAQARKRIHQCMRETVQPVAVLHDALALHIVEHPTNLLGGELVMIEKRDEANDRPLEVNVVFPERVVRVDQQSLG